jgi:hypothetical protein
LASKDEISELAWPPTPCRRENFLFEQLVFSGGTTDIGIMNLMRIMDKWSISWIPVEDMGEKALTIIHGVLPKKTLILSTCKFC